MVERFLPHGGTKFSPWWNDSSFVSSQLNLLRKKRWLLHEKILIIRGKRFDCREFSVSVLRLNKGL